MSFGCVTVFRCLPAAVRQQVRIPWTAVKYNRQLKQSKMKNRRKTKTPFWLLLLTTLAVGTSCSSEGDEPVGAAETPAGPQVIPYSVTAGDDAATRATLNGSNQLIFEDGDALAITGTNISGTLTLSEGNGERTAKFSGDLNYTGSGSPADNLELTATLTGTSGTQTGIAATFAEAFRQYSLLQGTSTYAARSFSLLQQTTFVIFNVTFTDGTPEGTAFNVSITDTNGDVTSGTTTTDDDSGDIKATFTLAMPGGTALTNAKAILTSSGLAPHELTFGGDSYTFAKNKYYAANRTIAPTGIQMTSDIADWTPVTGVNGSIQF